MKLLPVAALALIAASPAFAANTVIDFETVTSFASLNDFYNGGTDGLGNTGPSLGVSFVGGPMGLVNDEFSTFFSNAPTAVGVMAPVGSDGVAVMNVASGFSDMFSFYYSSASAVTDGVQVWSGLNGTGTLLASLSLAGNAQAGGCTDSAFCNFDQFSTTLSGTAHSVTFNNAMNVAAFDNISVSAVPEADGLAMAMLGLVGLAASRRRG